MGGACITLATAGVVPALIQAAGRWSSDEFQKYIRKTSHPWALGLGHRDSSKIDNAACSFRFCIIHCFDCISRECPSGILYKKRKKKNMTNFE
ncbi:uncharacterized protein F5147DRAFT_277936 [Suillus discolor]|uniref:Uncharacterized protein n=1 Tax=Suillus discolor TaxID=1912936 RepID=A0A9P7JRV6_9AGAM|nr:uncharacterized protein F5147DRAFT_277936 [Suillus discolor]KAG2103377.1 hypothetical protein F5147DRAFT_277936 [Suillus discolor]